MDKEINPIEFIEARSKEIILLEESLDKKRKKTQLYQRVPFFMRRRTSSYKHKKKKTKRKTPFLVSYIGKRFFTVNNFPLRRRLKSQKFIYKSKKTFLFYEFIYENYFIFEMFNEKRSSFDDSLLMHELSDTNVKDILVSDEFNDEIIKFDESKELYFIYHNKLICHKKNLSKLLFLKDLCLISIEEMFRLCIERMLVSKYINVLHSDYSHFEELIYKNDLLKNERRPLSKRVRIDKFIIKDYKYCCYFEVIKGNVKTNDSVIFNEEIVGHVLRIEYCYSVGRKRGICWLLSLHDNLSIINFCNKIVEIKIIKVIEKNEFNKI